MKPDWILWLEDNGYNVGLLRKDVYETYTRKGQAKAWLHMVRTQEGVEQWAKEVYARKGLTPRSKPHKSNRN